MDTLPQMIHRGQVFFPMRVEDLQHHGLLEIAHHIGAGQRRFVRIAVFDALQQPFAQLRLIELVLRFEPAFDIDLDGELLLQCRHEAADVPGLFDAVRGHVGVY